MAVPTVTNIYPNGGHSGGETLVRILGGGFGPDGVSVTFGGKAARKVALINHALVYAWTPISPLSAAETGAGDGLVDVAIQNLDTNGEAVPGELVTVVDGFEYRMPSFAKKSCLEHVVRTFQGELRRQVWREIILRRHTDYADAAGVVALKVQISMVPCIVLIGPQIVENDVYRTNRPTQALGERFLINRRPSLTVDFQFGLIGAADKERHHLGLQEATLGFFKKNTTLRVDRDPDDLSKGAVLFEMDWVPGNLPVIVEAPDVPNIGVFTGTVSIIGVVLEGFSTIDEVAESDFVNEIVGPEPNLVIRAPEQLTLGPYEPRRGKQI